MVDPSAAAYVAASYEQDERTGREPVLGGELREKAVWVDEAVCIGCRYCAHVATNTFCIEPNLGRSRAIRQDGDSTERIQEAIETCPVDCIHWVAFDDLPGLKQQLDAQELLPLGLPSPARLRRQLPRNQPRLMSSSALPTRRFGRTEIAMPVLSLGGMRFQQSWTDLAPDAITGESQRLLEDTLGRAVQAGFHHVETARHYGSSERQLGWALPESSDASRILQTKVPPRLIPRPLRLSWSYRWNACRCNGLICWPFMASTVMTISNRPFAPVDVWTSSAVGKRRGVLVMWGSPPMASPS